MRACKWFKYLFFYALDLSPTRTSSRSHFPLSVWLSVCFVFVIHNFSWIFPIVKFRLKIFTSPNRLCYISHIYSHIHTTPFLILFFFLSLACSLRSQKCVMYGIKSRILYWSSVVVGHSWLNEKKIRTHKHHIEQMYSTIVWTQQSL